MAIFKILLLLFTTLLVAACGGGNEGGPPSPDTFTISTSAGTGGSISPADITVNQGDTSRFTITLDAGFFIDTVTGCDGSLSGNSYTTGAITADCTVSAHFGIAPPLSAATLVLALEQVKNFRFSWTDVADATHYKLLENPDGSSGFTQVGVDIPRGIQGIDHVVSLPKRINAQYLLQSCNSAGCTGSVTLSISDNLVASIGYVKASNTGVDDFFGRAVALSGDGNTLAVGAVREESNAVGIGGNQADNSATDSGAVYLFTRSGSSWSQQAYVKASSSDAWDRFGIALALSDDGNTLAVGARGEGSNAVGIGGNQADNSATDSGAVYLFTRSGSSWGQQAYIKASNSDAWDYFGTAISLSDDGNTLAVGAVEEASNADGVGGDQSDNSVLRSGAVYLFTRSGSSWSQQAYLKASNTGALDWFGYTVALSGDGNTLAVGAVEEASNAIGIGGDQSDNSASSSGAVYLFIRSGSSWSQQAYIKASNSEAADRFGTVVALSDDGNTLAVGARGEGSNATNTRLIDRGNGMIYDADLNITWLADANYAQTSGYDADGRMTWDAATAWAAQLVITGSNGVDYNDWHLFDADPDDTSCSSWYTPRGFSNQHFGYECTGNTLGHLYYDELGVTRTNSINTSTDLGLDLFSNVQSYSYWASTEYVPDASRAWNFNAGYGSQGSPAKSNEYFAWAVRSGDVVAAAVPDSVGGGAVYLFSRSGSSWSQQAYIKASNSDAWDRFGTAIALSGDGNMLAVGASNEESNAVGIGGNQSDNSASSSGAVYLFTHSGGSWSQQAYVKASNSEAADRFGTVVALSDDGNTLAVGAVEEDSNASGVGGDRSDNSAGSSGAVYLY